MSKKGSYYEYKVMSIFEKYSYATLRTLGSGGGTKKPKPDIVASNGKNVYAMEIKHRNDDNLYINKYQVDELIEFSYLFGATPLIVVKFYRSPFFVFSPDTIELVGENYKINYGRIQFKHRCMELTEFIEKYTTNESLKSRAKNT